MDSPAAPTYRTGWLWAVLTVLLIFGTVASAAVVYGFAQLWTGGSWVTAAASVAIGLFGATICFLLLAGMLYRIDRLRGVPHRTVRLFE